MDEEEYAALLELIGQEIDKFTGFTDWTGKDVLAKRIARMVADNFLEGVPK